MSSAPRPIRTDPRRRLSRAALLGLGFGLGLGLPAAAAWEPEGVDLTRPRLLFRAGDEAAIRARLDRDPLPEAFDRVLDQLFSRIDLAESVALDDVTKEGQRIKGRAARNLAFLYAIDRTRIGGEVVPFPTPADRQAVGDQAAEYLRFLYDRSRLAVRPPLGGSDRDISSSEELINWATTYDTLKGAGYDFGADEAAIVEKLANLASELYENYVDPGSAQFFANLHKNNHRSKTGAALATAAVAIAEYTPAPGSDPRGVRDPADWLAYGLEQVDLVLRHYLVTGDGGYGEGPFYWRFTSQNLLAFARAWDRLVDGADWPSSSGAMVPSFWSHPLYRRSHRWMLDMTLPDGSLVHIDDGNPGRSHYFGQVPLDGPNGPAFAWRWANAPTAYETDGNIQLAPDALIHFDPDLVPAPPEGSPTAFYPEAGNAILRSDWSDEAVVAVIVGEYDVAAEFGTDRDGLGVGPQSHEHPDPGSFLLHAFGERLAIDPGYIEFGERDRVNQPQHHNLILVDGAGPVDYLFATVAWGTQPDQRHLADGMARLTDLLDTGFLDAARVTSRYGKGFFEPKESAPRFERRFLFPDHRYLVVADRVESGDELPHDFTWLLHGYGGGSSDGNFESTPLGGRWTRGEARLDGAIASDAGAPVLSTGTEDHEEPGKLERTHTVLKASVEGEAIRSLMLVVPSRSADAAPAIESVSVPGAAALTLDDPDGDRRVLAWHREGDGGPVNVAAATSGLADAESDGRLSVFDAATDGSLRLAFAERATGLAYDGVRYLDGLSPGLLAIGLGPDRAELVVDNEDAEVAVDGLPFAVAAADGACALVPGAGGAPPTVTLGRERRFTLRADPGNARPAADPGADRVVAPGSVVTLDASASCDSDGEVVAVRWELVSAPPRGSWKLEDADTWTPRLTADAAGPHRVRLVVTDDDGAESLPVEVTITAGGACEDGLDTDLDGLIDLDDPACRWSGAQIEVAPCQNGADDDADGLTDHGEDPQCRHPLQLSESNPRCGLGAEVAFVVAALAALRNARSRARRNRS